MNAEDERYFDNYFSLFITDGWKQFVEDATDNFNSIDITNCKTWEEYLRKATEKGMLAKIIKFEDSIRLSYDHMKAPTDLEIN